MDAPPRPEPRLNDTGPRRPQTTPEQAYHAEYGSPLYPAPGFKWQVNSTTGRLLPAISDEPSRPSEPRFALPKLRRLYRWHPDESHYSLVREDDDDGEEYEDNLYEYDAERLLFKRVIIVCEYDAKKDQFVRVAKSIK
jgi:hypothetical protein